MRILVVEDEIRLAKTLQDILEHQQFLVGLAATGPDGLDEALSGIYDLMLLDWMLPGMDGGEVARQLRARGSDLPILMLTAKGELEDRVAGLNAGADYYLAKPFDTRELLACIRVLLRRGGESLQPEVLSRGDLTLNLSTCILSCRENQIRLTARELEMLRLLMVSFPGVVPKETLLTKLWGYESTAEDNHVEVYVSFLRKKLRHLGSHMEIHTLRCRGYHLEAGT